MKKIVFGGFCAVFGVLFCIFLTLNNIYFQNTFLAIPYMLRPGTLSPSFHHAPLHLIGITLILSGMIVSFIGYFKDEK